MKATWRTVKIVAQCVVQKHLNQLTVFESSGSQSAFFLLDPHVLALCFDLKIFFTFHNLLNLIGLILL